MNDLNSLLIAGAVAHEPELRYTVKEIATCSFTIINERDTVVARVDVKTPGVTIMDGVLAKEIYPRARKGARVLVRGRLAQDRWVDSEGVAKSRTYMIAERVDVEPCAVVTQEATA